MGQEQCEIPHFQEDQEFEEDAMSVAWEERGGTGKISFSLAWDFVFIHVYDL